MVEKLFNLFSKLLVEFFFSLTYVYVHCMVMCLGVEAPSRSQPERERVLLFIDFKFYFSFNIFISFFLWWNSWDAIFEIHISSNVGMAWNMELGCLRIHWISNCWIIIICDNICIHHRSQTHCYVNWELRNFSVCVYVCDEKNVRKIFKYSIFGRNSFLKAFFNEIQESIPLSNLHMNMLNIFVNFNFH